MPRWRRRPSERPTEILEAALDVFTDRGLAGARMEDIATRAGISKGTLYLYFAGKEELFQEAIREKLRSILEGLASAAPPGEPVLRLNRFIDAYWIHLRRPHFASLYRLVMGELHQFPELTRFFASEVSGRVMDLLAEIIHDGTAAGSFRSQDPSVTSRMIVGLLVQHAVWASQRPLFAHLGTRTDEALVNETKGFVFDALLVPGVAPPTAENP